MSKQPESLLVKKIITAIEDMRKQGYHVKVRKRHGGAYGTSGEPDIEGCINGMCIQIEVKVPGNRPTKLQEVRLQEWSDAGACAFWTDDVDDALEYVKSRCNQPMRKPP